MKVHNLRPKNQKHHLMNEFGTVSGLTQEIRINRLEKRLTPLVAFPHRHSFYHLVMVTAGSGWHEIDFQRYSIQVPCLFVMKPGQVHSWLLDLKTKGIIIEFEQELLFVEANDRRILTALVKQLPAFIPLKQEKMVYQQKILPLINLMIEEYENSWENFEKTLHFALPTFLMQLSRMTLIETNQMDISYHHKFLQRFLILLEKYYKNQHGVEFYAQQLQVTAKALTMRVTRGLGHSPRFLLQQRCLLESKRLLAYSELNMSEIGEEVGFEDANYFSRFFRLKTKMSPGHFRRQVRSLC